MDAKGYLGNKIVWETTDDVCFGDCNGHSPVTKFWAVWPNRNATNVRGPGFKMTREKVNALSKLWIDHFLNKHPLRHPKFSVEFLGDDYYDGWYNEGVIFRFKGVPYNQAMANIQFVRGLIYQLYNMSFAGWEATNIEELLVLAYCGSTSTYSLVPGNDMWFEPYDSCHNFWSVAAAVGVELGIHKADIVNPWDKNLAGEVDSWDGVNDIQYVNEHIPNICADGEPLRIMEALYRYGDVLFPTLKSKVDMVKTVIKMQTDGLKFPPYGRTTINGVTFNCYKD